MSQSFKHHHKTNTTVFTILFTIKEVKAHLSSSIIGGACLPMLFIFQVTHTAMLFIFQVSHTTSSMHHQKN